MSNPIVISVGTRPEIIKMAPLYQELQRRGLPVAWVHTGQHSDMAQPLYAFFGIEPAQTLDLQRRNGSLAHLNALLLEGLSALFERIKPRAVLVHGDTTSTLASAQAAFYNGVPVGHVEAGLRTFNHQEPFPEEMNRELTARLSHWHFSPTPKAATNLRNEGVPQARISTVGNTAVDAALAGTGRVEALLQQGVAVLPEPVEALRQRLRPAKWRLITVTAHRRENWGQGIADIAGSVADLLDTHEDLAVVWPVHGNPAVSDAVRAQLGHKVHSLNGRLVLCPPLDYPAMLWCLQNSTLALTDSGGIQEEGAALSCPVLVLRNTTERPELIDAGAGMIVGTERTHVTATVTTLLQSPSGLQRMRDAVNPFGDGTTSKQVADVLQQALGL